MQLLNATRGLQLRTTQLISEALPAVRDSEPPLTLTRSQSPPGSCCSCCCCSSSTATNVLQPLLAPPTSPMRP
jgi:hypothetical protein